MRTTTSSTLLIRGTLAVGLVSANWLLTAQEPVAPRPDQDPSAQLCSIKGTVTGVADGSPIPDAVVAASGPGPKWTTKTGPDGRYVLVGIPPGSYAVFPRKDGYGLGISARPKRVRLIAGQTLSSIDFQLKKEAVLAGRVLDEEKKPLRGIRVMSWVREYHRGRQVFLFRGGVPTDDLGEFRISGFTEGRYYLSAVPSLVEFRKRATPDIESRAPRQENVRTFYFNASSFDAAAVIPVAGGDQHEALDIILLKADTFCVVGAVVGAGAEASNLTLYEVSSGWNYMVASGSAADGQEFELCGLPRGSYSLVAITSNPGGHATRFARSDFLVSNRNIQLGRIPLYETTRIQARLSIAGAEPDGPKPKGLSVELLPRDRDPYLNEISGTTIEGSGEFALGTTFPDDYWVVFRPPAGSYIKQATCGTRDALRETVRPGCGKLEIVMRADAGSVYGSVRDDKDRSVSDGAVVLAPDPLPAIVAPESLLRAHLDQDGAFQFASVAPGEYRLAAVPFLDTANEQDPEFVRQWYSKGTKIQVKTRERTSLTVKALDVR